MYCYLGPKETNIVGSVTLDLGHGQNIKKLQFSLFFYMVVKGSVTLTFKWLGRCLNFSVWFMKNMSVIWTEKDKLWNKRHFVENKMEIME